jgi:hypothetical protein
MVLTLCSVSTVSAASDLKLFGRSADAVVASGGKTLRILPEPKGMLILAISQRGLALRDTLIISSRFSIINFKDL